MHWLLLLLQKQQLGQIEHIAAATVAQPRHGLGVNGIDKTAAPSQQPLLEPMPSPRPNSAAGFALDTNSACYASASDFQKIKYIYSPV